MTVVQLRELARANKVRLPYGVNKAQMVETLFRQLGSGMKPAQAPAEQPDIGLYKPKPLGFTTRNTERATRSCRKMLKAGLLASGHGVLGGAARRLRLSADAERHARARTISMCRLRRFAGSTCTAAMKSSARRGRSGWATDTTR